MRIALVFIIVSLVFTACDTSSNLNNCDFDESAMLTNYADNLIIPRFESLASELQELESATATFNAVPSVPALEVLQLSFSDAYLTYQRCSQFGFGPGLIDGVPFRDRFNIFPTNASVIEQNIAGSVAVNTSPQSTVGFPAVEYLLYGNVNQSNQQVLEAFTTGSDAAKRKVYLEQLVSELKTTTESILSNWETYKNDFVGNTGSSLGTSLSMMSNELNRDYEILKNFKFKIPVGRLNGGVVLPEKVEGYYSGKSSALAFAQMEGIRDVFLGVSENGIDGQGIDNYLVCLDVKSSDQLLSAAIQDRMTSILFKLEDIPDPMSEHLVSNQSQVDEAYTEMQMMVPLIKHEMTSAFGVQINYESGDGD